MDRTTLRELRRKAKRFDELERVVGELRQRYSALESIFPDPLAFCDSDGRIEHVNARFAETFGRPADEVRGKIAPYLPRSQRADHLKRLKEVVDGREPPFRFHGLCMDGTVMDLIAHAWVASGESESPAGFLTAFKFAEPGAGDCEDPLPQSGDTTIETVSEQSSDDPTIDVMKHCEGEVRLRDTNADLLKRSGDLEEELGRVTGDLKLARQKLAKARKDMTDVNQAAKLLVSKVAEQKKELQESIGHNLGITVHPLLDHLKTMKLTEAQRHIVETLDFNLKHIAASFGVDFTDRKLRLSAREIEICRMIRSGKDSGQIAEAFGLAKQTIVAHRKNIRKKLGLKKNKQNLAAYLKEHL